MKSKNKLGEEVYAKLAPSKIDGIGVFAIRDIPKGICPFKTKTKISWQRINLRDIEIPEVQQLAKILLVPDEEGNVDIPKGGLNYLGIDFYLNHSETPNVMWNDVEEEPFITLREIKANEELTFNYQEIKHIIV